MISAARLSEAVENLAGSCRGFARSVLLSVRAERAPTRATRPNPTGFFNSLSALLFLALFWGCGASPSRATPQGRFRLTGITDAESNSPGVFPAEGWVSGLLAPEEPVFLDIQGPKVDLTGFSTVAGVKSASYDGKKITFSLIEDEDGIRLDLSFEGVYDPARDEIRGTLQQIWELTEETGNTRLVGEAVFSRLK